MERNLRMTGAVAASDAARVLADPNATGAERSAAASALAQPAHHARLIRPFTHWFVLRRARRGAARRTFTRGSADFARARVLAALDLLSWLDHRGQALRDLTYPVARAFALLGRGASSVELHQLRQPLRSALTLT